MNETFEKEFNQSSIDPAQQLAANKAYGGVDNQPPAYLEQEVLLWSKEKLTLKTYDLFIVSCQRHEIARMNKILVELMGAINFEQDELQATRLYRIYEYCQKCIFEQKFDESLTIIKELRDAWAQAFELE
ncbi:MAG: flagellar protein FliS [Candidatus Kapabacteria bacterium]|jgi:flagellar protein FliS|nr:flagellar protein FliS [Candidatus Kapabacteria bacterium]